MSNYSRDPKVALDEMAEDLSHDFVIDDGLSFITWDVAVTSLKRVKHDGADALQRTLKMEPNLHFRYCTEYANQFILLDKRWQRGVQFQQVLISGGSWCKGSERYTPDAMKAAKSFRQINY